MGSDLDGTLYNNNGSVWQNANGNRNVACLNRDASKRNLNLNWVENDWNEICRFAAVRNSLLTPTVILWEHCFAVVSATRQASYRSRLTVQKDECIAYCPRPLTPNS